MELCNPILIPVKERLKLREDNLGELVDPTNFRGMIGRLFCLTPIRPFIVLGVRLVSKFMTSPHQSHLQAIKCILRYIKGMQSDDIFYTYGNKIELIRCIDTDQASAIEKRKSTLSYAFNLGS